MAVANKPYLALVKDAYQGSLKLPAFQRDWVWKGRQTCALFDSVRQGFPIGAFLFASESLPVDLGPKEFKFSQKLAEDKKPDFLVLDGQQRITAGIQLFYGTSSDNGDTLHFFIDLNKVNKLYKIFCETNGLVHEEFEKTEEFIQSLDQDDRYIVSKKASKNPNKLLIDKHLLFVPLLRPDKFKDFDVFSDNYTDTYPERREFYRKVIKSFRIVETPNVPYISLEDNLTVESISRIFSTLNTSGKMLSPFELVVAILFPAKIDLRDDIEKAKSKYLNFYPKMDKTGEIVLQTAVLIEGLDPKKSNLPKTLKPEVWKKNQELAFELLEQAGKFLSENLGFALDKTNELIPYDSIFAPLAVILHKTGYAKLPPKQKVAFSKGICRWIAASVFSQRFQEGVHNKQKSDADRVTKWLKGDIEEPDWITEARVPALTSVDPKGAIGKFISCIVNQLGPVDPLDNKKLSVGDPYCQYHHIFPTKFVEKLQGWDSDNMTANRALNIMLVRSSTNQRFGNDDPNQQYVDCVDAHTQNIVNSAYSKQLMNENCINIITKNEKTAKDFRDFMKLREGLISDYVVENFNIAFSGGELEDEDFA